jgi:hypothetical protein
VRFANRVQNSPGPMRINRIIGDKIYVGSQFFRDDDGLAWSEGNFVLDSEWGPTVEKKKKEIPVIEKGIPAPKRQVRNGRGERPPSIWPEFLKRLEVGDSFVVGYPAASTVKVHIRSMRLPFVWQVLEGERTEKGMAKERFWRVAEEDSSEHQYEE